jgi:hypothetical protein
MSFRDLNWPARFLQFSRVSAIRRLMSYHLRLLRHLYGNGPVPLSYWLRFRSILKRLCRSRDLFFSSRMDTETNGAYLPVEDLAEFLQNDSLGGWALDGETISFLWDLQQHDKPSMIIECGAGLTTLVFAKSLEGYSLDSSGSLLSVEQNLWMKKAVERRLQGCGLQQYVTVMHAPVSGRGEYQIDADQLRVYLGSERADWIVIDGPAGPDGCRASTLPSLAQFCHPGTRWFLDDAYRDGELEVLSQWTRLTGVVVDGIVPIGKGLGTGIVTDPGNVGNCMSSLR